MTINFKNTYLSLPGKFYEKSLPNAYKNAKLVIFNDELAKELGICDLSEQEQLEYFSGQKIAEGSTPIALAYAGFQFGHPVPELGDGRAHLLGELNCQDIQLKGSGKTRFSRRGDGKSALGPVLREYLVSEAMNKLDVPTTRALCAVSTGEEVYRQFGPEPGGVFTRVASSHIRVGTFQYFHFKKDYAALEDLLNYTIIRHYPELKEVTDLSEKCLALLIQLTNKQSDLIAKWSGLGFIHGVMNTDNFSMAGITIDYGPCAFMDEFEFNKVFSSIDRNGRYAFSAQTSIAKWNILRLADCLLSFIDPDQNKAIEKVEAKLEGAFDQFDEKRSCAFAKKLGITDYQKNDDKLVLDFLSYLEKNSLDFTNSFRMLPELFDGNKRAYTPSSELDEFVNNWKKRVQSTSYLNNINPAIIPRNHLIQKAIEAAYQDDFESFHKLHDILKRPFELNEDNLEFSKPPTSSEKVKETFCGT